MTDDIVKIVGVRLTERAEDRSLWRYLKGTYDLIQEERVRRVFRRDSRSIPACACNVSLRVRARASFSAMDYTSGQGLSIIILSVTVYLSRGHGLENSFKCGFKSVFKYQQKQRA